MKKEFLLSYPEILEEIPAILLTHENKELRLKFKKFFQIKYSNLYADIESLVINGPDCSCNRKIKNYINEDLSKLAETIIEFFSEEQEIELDELFSSIELELISESISGKVFKTSIKKWPEFAEEISQHQYNSFSVVKEGEDLFVFFL